MKDYRCWSVKIRSGNADWNKNMMGYFSFGVQNVGNISVDPSIALFLYYLVKLSAG